MFVADLIVFVCMVLLYFLPFFIARSRNHKNTQTVFWINLLLGWVIIFWIPLIIYSLASDAQQIQTHGAGFNLALDVTGQAGSHNPVYHYHVDYGYRRK